MCCRVFFLFKVATVEGFINSVDTQMRQRQERQMLTTISARIDSYEAVEGSSEEVEKVRAILDSQFQLGSSNGAAVPLFRSEF